MSDHRHTDPTNEDLSHPQSSGESQERDGDGRVREMAEIIDQVSHEITADEAKKKLYRLKKRLFDLEADWRRCAQEREKMEEILEKLSSPAFRMGTLLGKTEEGLGWIAVGGSDYFSQIDPRINPDELEAGQRVRLNEALSIVGTAGPEPFGAIVQVSKVLPDGRVEIGGDRSVAGAPSAVVGRAASLKDVPVVPGDSLRLDNTSRLAVEYLGGRQENHLLEEVPEVSWKDVGGQKKAIEEIQKAILNPVLHEDLYARYRFRSPKGFLLFGPPGCGKTLIGKATAHQLALEMQEKEGRPIKGVFFHIKGPEIFNMWLGESERIVRELFEQGREARKRGDFPVLFIDEAEAILGTRRSIRSFNIHNTLVPMFCAEMDGMSGPNGFMVILATNRPEMIDPAILRPGRIDRKIRVVRPDREAAMEIISIYLTGDIPIAGIAEGVSSDQARQELANRFLEKLYAPTEENAVLEVVLRSGKREVLHRSDLASGALLASIVDRAKEKALLREMGQAEGEARGVSLEDLLQATNDEFEEGDIVPATDGAEDWMTLLDLRQRDVVDLKRFDSGNRERKVLERRAIE
jgi:proteasome-associated ATPase|uniref:AAA family ATPase n=1 Tax=Leptospirillum ferriphilum TaxID=178606 RepID=A0A7C3LWP9_9BACT